MIVAQIILELTANVSGISVKEIKSHSATRDISDVRKIAVALLKEHNFSSSAIKRFLGYKDTSGISKAFERHQQIMDEGENIDYTMTFKRIQHLVNYAMVLLKENIELTITDILEAVNSREQIIP